MTLPFALWLLNSLSVVAQNPPPVEPGTREAKQDPQRIDQLIRDLGGDQKTRDRARQELREIGRPALPALRKAAKDTDAERAMAARSLLLEMMGKDGKAPAGAADVRVVYHDWPQGIDFVRDEGGRITLTVPENDSSSGKRAFKTYSADSLEEFKKRYPDIAKTFEVDKLASPPDLSKEMLAEWRRLRENLDLPDGASGSEVEREDRDLEQWIERQERMMERRLHQWDERESTRPSEKGATLGILVGPPPSALRAQLHLPENEGLLIYDVQPGSLAEKSGLKKYDILTKLNGQAVRDIASFRKELESTMKQDRLILEVVREGKPHKVEIQTPPQEKK